MYMYMYLATIRGKAKRSTVREINLQISEFGHRSNSVDPINTMKSWLLNKFCSGVMVYFPTAVQVSFYLLMVLDICNSPIDLTINRSSQTK